jgi:hypothetical protein
LPELSIETEVTLQFDGIGDNAQRWKASGQTRLYLSGQRWRYVSAFDPVQRPGMDAEASFDGQKFAVLDRSQRKVVFGSKVRPTNVLFIPMVLMEPIVFTSMLSDDDPGSLLTPDIARRNLVQPPAMNVERRDDEMIAVGVVCGTYMKQESQRVLIFAKGERFPTRIEFRLKNVEKPISVTTLRWRSIPIEDTDKAIDIPVHVETTVFDPSTGKQIAHLANRVRSARAGAGTVQAADLSIDFRSAEAVFDDDQGAFIRNPDEDRSFRPR